MFVISRLFWLIAEPGNVLILLLVAGIALVWSGRERWGRPMVVVAAALMLAVTLFPLAQWLAQPLEDSFPRPVLPRHVDGILVLGGGLNPGTLASRGAPAHDWSEARVVEGVALARRYPDAKIVFSGGTGGLWGKGREASVAGYLFRELGIAPGRIVLEDRSRNTWENFVFSKRLLKPRPGETWILVTSAFHMPRAMGVARHLGWNMIAWPAAYISPGHWRARFNPSYAEQIVPLTAVLHEWVGLVAYRIEGRTDSLLP